MRKILISILLILLIILAYFTMFHGITIGSFKILSSTQIKAASEELNEKKDEANRKVATDLQEKKAEVLSSVQTLLQNKENYYSVANVSTEKQLTQASTEEVYNSEYLYLQIGSHAREEGVKMKLNILSTEDDSNVKDLSFTITGKYVGIMDFISAIEDDSELNFTIEDFTMEPNEDNELEATFKVTGIKVILDETSEQSSSSSSTVQDILGILN